MHESEYRQLEHATRDAFAGVLNLSLIRGDGWPGTNCIWFFLKALRIFRTWMYRDFKDNFSRHEKACRAASFEGFTIGELPHTSPLHALKNLSERIAQTFDSFECNAKIDCLPLTLAIRKRSNRTIVTSGGRREFQGKEYSSLFEDILDAWPVRERPKDAPYALYHPDDHDVEDPATGKVHVGTMFPGDVVAIIERLRDAERIDAAFENMFPRSQWISILNLWIAAKPIEDWFRAAIDQANWIDHQAWWQAISRQLGRVEEKLAGASNDRKSIEMAAGAKSTLSTEPSPCPVVLQGQGNPILVYGIEKRRLTPVRYNVVAVLCKRWPKRPTLDQLKKESGSGDADNRLRDVRGIDRDWEAVISFPNGEYSRGYGFNDRQSAGPE